MLTSWCCFVQVIEHDSETAPAVENEVRLLQLKSICLLVRAVLLHQKML
jgi:hypothetical protein